MKRAWIYGLLLFSALSLRAAPILGTASTFSVLGASTVTNTGSTTLSGDLGVSPGASITGFPPGVFTGTIYPGTAVATEAEHDALAAYNQLRTFTCAVTQDLTGQDLGGLTLTPGAYTFNSSAQLTGLLTLDLMDDPNALFIFRIGSTLTTASSSSVTTNNGPRDDNVYWLIGSSATLGMDSGFQGNIIADQSITLTTGAHIANGSALALNGAVTLDTNDISGSAPEPATLALLGAGLIGLRLLRRRQKRAT